MNDERKRALKSIFKGGVIVFLGIIASKFLGLLFRVIVGRYIGPEEYGVISVMIAVFTSMTTIVYMGVPNGVHKYVAEFRGNGDTAAARGTVRSGLIMLTASSLVAGAALFVLAPWLSISVFNEPRLVVPLRMTAVIIPFRAYAMVFTSVTDAFERMQYNVYTDRIGMNVVKVALTGIAVYLGYGYVGAAFGYAVSFAFTVVLGYYFSNKLLPDIFSPSAPAAYNYRELFSHSWPLLAAGVFGIITGKIDTFMLQYFLASREVGLYNAAYPFAVLLTMGAGMFTGIFLSNASRLIAKGHKDELAASYRTTVKWVSIVTVPIFLILVAFPRTALVVFGTEYYAVDNVLRVLAVGFLLNALIGPVKQIYQSISRTRLVMLVSIILAVSNATLNYLLIPRYGVMGAAIASTAAFVLVFIVKLALLHRVMGIQPFRATVFKVWAAGVLAILGVYATANTLFAVTPPWFFPVALGMFGLLYGGFLLVFRTIEEDDIMILKTLKEKTGIEIDWLEDLVRRFT